MGKLWGIMLAAVDAVDALNRRLGRLMVWPILFAVFISAGNAISRKLFDLSSNAMLELQWYLFGLAFLGAAGYVLLVDEHVLLAPVADKLGVDLVWFGVLVGINLQTSVLAPPFGFALFYLRSVAPARAHRDEASGKVLPGVSTVDIYWGVLPFIAGQAVVMALVIGYPQLLMRDDAATGSMDSEAIQKALDQLERPQRGAGQRTFHSARQNAPACTSACGAPSESRVAAFRV